MCEFGDSSKILRELNITKEEGITGHRGWYIINPFKQNKKLVLKSLNREFIWGTKPILKSKLGRGDSLGFYCYNYNYNNYYNNYYNKYNYYYICGKCTIFGKIFEYKAGYRASNISILSISILDDSKWFKDNNTRKFAQHFNQTVVKVAKIYNCKVESYSEFIKS